MLAKKTQSFINFRNKKGMNHMGPYRVPAMSSTENQCGNLQTQGTSQPKASKCNHYQVLIEATDFANRQQHR
jgi:hypothetical protein